MKVQNKNSFSTSAWNKSWEKTKISQQKERVNTEWKRPKYRCAITFTIDFNAMWKTLHAL